MHLLTEFSLKSMKVLNFYFYPIVEFPSERAKSIVVL